MHDYGKIGGLRMLRPAVVVGLALSLLIIPGVNAGHLATSPARLERFAKPQIPDAVAIRGVTSRDSTGAEDLPAAVVGRATGSASSVLGVVFGILGEATGDASGQDAATIGVRGRATGNATGPDSGVFAIDGRATGNATGPGSVVFGARGRTAGNATGQEAAVLGVEGRVIGDATGPGSALFGVQGRVRGNFTGQNAFVVGVRGIVDGIPTGPGAVVVGVLGRARATSGNAQGVAGRSDSTSGIGVLGHAAATSGNTVGIQAQSDSPGGTAFLGLGNNGAKAAVLNGRVDINCPATPCVFVNGTGVADLAEDMAVAGRVFPGDVVVLARGQEGYGVARAGRPYDTRVAGIISAQPRMVFGVRQGKPSAPVAMVGAVRAKATAANGSIEVGDLLTTSRVPGHLMRCPAPQRCVGAIVGKALEPLAKGENRILVLLWRQ